MVLIDGLLSSDGTERRASRHVCRAYLPSVARLSAFDLDKIGIHGVRCDIWLGEGTVKRCTAVLGAPVPMSEQVSPFSSSVTGQRERVVSPFDHLHVDVQVPLSRHTFAISGYLRQKVSDGGKDPTRLVPRARGRMQLPARKRAGKSQSED